MSKNDYWDLTNRPHTKLKLEIYKKYLDSWCAIFLNQKYYEEVFIVDCFAGRGEYKEKGDRADGSPLIAVKAAKKFQDDFDNKKIKNKRNFKIKCRFIDENKKYCKSLEKLLAAYINDVDFQIINDDFNNTIGDVLKEIGYKPVLFFIDPHGIKSLKKKSVLSIVNKPGAKDILLNYINEGVVRIAGLAKKCMDKKAKDITLKEIKTITNLTDFVGDECLEIIDSSDVEFLEYYVENILKSNNENVNSKNKLDVIAFNMPYPNKSDTIYYLLFASRNKNAIKIVSQVYAKSKESNLKGQRSFFGPKEQLKLHNNFKV
ncbi:MAG: three-Cys-motif partner protein TcmP [bacterium]|nr:three-Cys-motif partner protein TcmP [bacterium]